MANTVKVRSGTAAQLVTLGALEAGELGRETDTDKMYIGDGTNNHEILVLGTAMGENNAIMLEPTLSADGKYSGIVETGIAGVTLAFGDLCYFAVADSRWELADATVVATSKGRLGICVLAATGDAEATTMLTYGKIRADTAFSALTTVGAPVFVSETPGDVTSTIPTKATDVVVRIIGEAVTGNVLFFKPDGAYVEYV